MSKDTSPTSSFVLCLAWTGCVLFMGLLMAVRSVLTKSA